MNRLIKFTNKNNLNIEIGIYPPYLLTRFEESTNVQIYSRNVTARYKLYK